MLKIRPHHILCIRAYQGHGYSEEFNINMKKVIKEIDAYNKTFNKVIENEKSKYLKYNVESKKVDIVFSLDDICKKCPNNIEGKECITEKMVNELDLQVINFFNIEEKGYYYKDLENLVYSKLNEEIFDEICKNCSWYKSADCKSFVLNKF